MASSFWTTGFVAGGFFGVAAFVVLMGTEPPVISVEAIIDGPYAAAGWLSLILDKVSVTNRSFFCGSR
jgi:hypothetical protein